MSRTIDMGKWTIRCVAAFFIGLFIYFSIPFNQSAIFPHIVGCYSDSDLENGVQFEILPGFIKFGDKIVAIEAGRDKAGYFIVPKHGLSFKNNGTISINSGNSLMLRFGSKNEYLEIINTDGSVVRLSKNPCN